MGGREGRVGGREVEGAREGGREGQGGRVDGELVLKWTKCPIICHTLPFMYG